MLDLLINDILDYSQIKQKKQLRIRETKFELFQIFSELESIFHFQCEAKNIELKYIGDKSIVMNSDRLRVKQILMNLIGNAIKFTEKGKITVSATTQTHQNIQLVSLQVKDTGIGISDQRQRNLFKIFSTFDDGSHNNTNGVGLGLTISKDLVGLLGPKKTINLQSKVQVGKQQRISQPVVWGCSANGASYDNLRESGINTWLNKPIPAEQLKQKLLELVQIEQN
ncbi:Histidine kinase-like ATPase, ATP-binding domain [Pseudocohnilembus persalinus]|uniref:Histidine kinase-like ATPase, ATP-binding domain n=1 Tax=Pseudocohnilembus persalinus TaxID=266149 RepID=A0A0V0QY34_PSEPJ|nr:Histidine kinase-like ATPase, ATP-binding domain [Pseudocohnilembus persalinus]|eukprot:KRX06824.1 Histidine kinase-like ATPase, ATP-binding domain [Pseudocohnilembus persalinus]